MEHLYTAASHIFTRLADISSAAGNECLAEVVGSCSHLSSHLGACVYFLVNLNNGDKMKPGPFMAVVAAAARPLVGTHGSRSWLRTSL